MINASPTSAGRDVATQMSLLPGDIKCTHRGTTLTTVLGSCVAVCLWDAGRGVGGMNHFVLPNGPSGDRSTRYGDVAISELIGRMRRLGSHSADLTSKLFGGAAVLPFVGKSPVGTTNVHLAVAELDRHMIPIVAQRTGGTLGQYIRFDTRTGEVLLRYVNPQAKLATSRDLAPIAAAISAGIPFQRRPFTSLPVNKP